MKISIVTAVYNRKDTIGDTLASVAAQTGVEIEHIIQDGGSTDGTLEVIAAQTADHIHLRSEPDGGIYDAINKGIERATGDIVGLMHSDDTFAGPEVLRDVQRVFEETAADGVYGDLDYVSASNPGHVIRRWRSGSYDPSKLRRGWMPPHPTLYLRRSVFDQYGLYDTSFRIAADYEAMLRYLKTGDISLSYLPAVMVKMRMGGASNRSLKQIARKSQEDFRAIRRHRVGGIGTLFAKNMSKLGQFTVRD